jgi:hypothetical protein
MKDDKPEVSDQDKALAKRWGKRLEKALKTQTKLKVEERYKKLRHYVRGDVGGDDQPGLVRTNIIHSNFAAILPQIYAKNPEIAVSQTEAVGDSAEWVPGFCKTMQAVLNRVFIKDGNLKPRAKAAIRAAMTTGIGWAKVSWQKDIKTDPLIETRLADTQDNIQRIRHLIAEIEDGDESKCELEAKQAELEQQLASLRQQAEVSTVEGIAIDRVLTEDMFILDDTMYDFDGYPQAEALAHRVWMTVDKYKQTFGKDAPKTANKYGGDKKERGLSHEDTVELVAVFETWDRTSNRVFTLCSGADEWARDPYTPETLGNRFYPFFALAFNPTDGTVHPLSDTELLTELQDEYNTTRTNFAEHRKENLPTRVYRKSGDLTDGDIKALANRQANQWVGIEGNPDTPITQDIAILPNPPVDPMTYDVQPILRDAEMVLGAGDAAKGSINKAKTATEAEIMAQGLQSRIAERQDVVEDWIAEMARFSAELCLQELTLPQVQRIAGQDAVWPQLNKSDVFSLVQVEIRAGSSGRPNKAKEREQWGQMLPQIQQSVQQIMELRTAGQNDMAETVMKLLEETLRRFDERIDIETFLPPRKEEEAPQIPPEMQQQMQQAQEQMQAMQAENQQLQEAASGTMAKMELERERFEFEKKKAIDDANFRNQSAEMTLAAKAEEARIKAEAQIIAAEKEAMIRADIEREKIASQERIALAREMSQMCQTGAMQSQQVAAEESQAAEKQEQAQESQAMQQMLGEMQQAMQNMAQMFSQSLASMQQQITAPKRVIRDPETGDMIGVETVQ